MQLSHSLLSGLADYGAREIFGIPGDFALPFFRDIERLALLQLHTLSHEPAVGFAADAAARYRGSISVAAVTYGAGALNIVNAAAQAYAEKSPVVFISGAPAAAESNAGLGLHHQVKHLGSQAAVFAEVTCAQAVLRDAASAPGEIAKVLAAARDLSRPVYIELPRDLVAASSSPVPRLDAPGADLEAARACASEIIARLEAAERPVLMLGVEVRRHRLEAKVAELTRVLGIPVTTSFMGRGILAGSDAPLIGTYLGMAGDTRVRECVEGADALLMLGVILCDTNFGVSEKLIARTRMIHAFDRAVRFGHHLYPNLPLDVLVEALLEQARPIGKAQREVRVEAPRGLQSDDRPILPDDIARGVNDLFDAKGRMPIASDMGDCLFTAMDIAHTELVAPAYYATMGPGIPMGLGLQLASGRRPLVLVGDGAFQMTGMELGNARRLGLNPIVLVFNNSSWGMLKVFQPGTHYNDLGTWRCADIASALGGVGRRVETREQLGQALAAAAEDTSNWQLVEIMIPRGEYSRTLTRFVAAVSQRGGVGRGA